MPQNDRRKQPKKQQLPQNTTNKDFAVTQPTVLHLSYPGKAESYWNQLQSCQM